jgi:3-methyladenine DNA glycosylase AlkD
VIKAMSWALRELSRPDRGAVHDFLEEYQSQLAARVVREVQHKLMTGVKKSETSGLV